MLQGQNLGCEAIFRDFYAEAGFRSSAEVLLVNFFISLTPKPDFVAPSLKSLRTLQTQNPATEPKKSGLAAL